LIISGVGPREVTEGGGGEWELNQILLKKPAYVPSLIPKAKTLQEGDEHRVMNAMEKE
jgi:hypothetical protein